MGLLAIKLYRGMEVAEVKSITASKDKVITTANIRSDIILTEGTRFLVSDSSLMGGKALNIIPEMEKIP